MKINLHIDRLVLDGVDVATGQRDILQTSVINELTQLLSNGSIAGNSLRGIGQRDLSPNAIQLTNSKADKLGQQIAQSVFGGISRE